MPSPAIYNLVVPQATTFTFQFYIQTDNTRWNLTNYSATMTVRPFAGATTTTLVGTNTNGVITIAPLDGQLTITYSAVQTDLPASTYEYDIVLNSGGTITRILEGKFIVTAGVTV